MKNDFSKFTCFVKGVIESGYVIKHGENELRNEAKMYFNRILSSCVDFEKFLHKNLGEEVAQAEDDINCSIIGMVWKLYDLEAEDRERFVIHLNNFDLK
jgi:hypothetical protein